jgi:CubicO group peptidase (beta-lactamase class C family)
MTSEMLVKLLDQGVVKLNDPLSKYARRAPGCLTGRENQSRW